MTIIALNDCPICHSHDFAIMPVPQHWDGEVLFGRYSSRLGLMRCNTCDFVFVNPRPDQSLLDLFYSSADFAYDADEASERVAQKAEIQLAEVERFMPPRNGARLLDYGCGEGILLQKAIDAGWNAIGYDIGAPAIASCQRRGLPVVNAPDDIAEMKFDVIFLSHVFEHLIDPSHTLEYLKTKLTPNGLLCLEVPNAGSLRALLSPPVFTDWLGFDERYRAFPIHLSYFTSRTLLRLLEKHGVEVERATTVGLGLDRLIFQPDERQVDSSNSSKNRTPSVRGKLRRFVIDAAKKVFFGSRMGENLLVIGRMSADPR